MDSGFQLANRQAEAYEALSGVFMRPSAELIVDSMGLGPGDQVLDLACGTGLVARAVWPRVAPGGRVVGVDVNPAMLGVARSLAGESEIEWVESSAQQLPFEDAGFTHVVCQQGFQFLPDGSAAAGEAHRVLRDGGVLVATIWAVPGRNPYIETQLALLAELDEAVAASAEAATPQRADELLTKLATTAGFSDISMSLLEHAVEVADLKSFFLDQTASTPWAPVITALSEGERAELADTLVTRLEDCSTRTGSHVLRFCSHRLVARK